MLEQICTERGSAAFLLQKTVIKFFLRVVGGEESCSVWPSTADGTEVFAEDYEVSQTQQNL